MTRPHLPEKKRIRSVLLGSIESVLTTVTQDKVADSHQWEDDVTVIGIQFDSEVEILDVAMNADGLFNYIQELSRGGTRAMPGSLGRDTLYGIWTAAISAHGPLRQTKTYFAPEGYGWDFDEGSVINLLAYLHYTGGVASVPMYTTCTVFYVER